LPLRISGYLEIGGRRYRLVVEEASIEAKWRLGDGLAGLLHIEPGKLSVDVREGLGEEILRVLHGKGRMRRMMEAARLLSCATGLPVELRVHGRRVATLSCPEGG